MALTEAQKNRLPKLTVKGDYSCCGLINYHSFHIYTTTDKSGVSRKITKIEADYILEKALVKSLGGTASLTSNQKEIWGSTLKKFGWKESGSFKNPNSGNVVHIYTYAP